MSDSHGHLAVAMPEPRGQPLLVLLLVVYLLGRSCWARGEAMTETRWLSGTNPTPLLTFLLRWASPRKLRLFCCACCRRVGPLLTDERSRRAVEVAELFADEMVTALDRAAAEKAAYRAYYAAGGAEQSAAAKAACWTVAAQVPVRKVAGNTLPFYFYPDYHLRGGQRLEKETQQAQYLRELFGNPFRPVTIDPVCLTRKDGTVVKLAQAIYDDRAFDRLPILADALEEAGCTDTDILAHLREPGAHTRGCWALDLLTGRC